MTDTYDYKVIRANIPLGAILYPNSFVREGTMFYKISDFVHTINLHLKNGYNLYEKTSFYDDCVSNRDDDIFPLGAPFVCTGSSIMITQCLIKNSSDLSTDTEYGIITNIDIRNVNPYENMINEELKNGWKLHGPHADLKNGRYKRFTMQALVKQSVKPIVYEKTALEKNVDIIQSDVKSLSHLYENINKLNHVVEDLVVNKDSKDTPLVSKCKQPHYNISIQFILTLIILVISVVIQLKSSSIDRPVPLLLDHDERSK